MKALGRQFLDQLHRQLRLALVDVARLEAALRFEEAEGEGKGDGVEHAIGVDRDDAVGQRMDIADVLVRGVVGRLALLAVARLVDAEDERALPQRLAGQRQPDRAQRLHRPVGLARK